MQLTQEQVAIIQSVGDIKINAVAGSGKTTTIIEYAKSRPANARILYVAFNKTVKLHAKQKFAEAKLYHVTVETAHSLAYRHVVIGSNFRIRKQDYKSYEIAELLGIQGSGEKHTEYIIANHINKLMAYFCNSNKERVQQLDYLEVVSEPKARTFVTTFYQYIQTQARVLLGKMNTGEIEITHDFYLKKFQLLKPILPYDYILFDEGQDASPAMLEVFLNQPATKVIVGDTHQQIYSWRHAVNSLEQVPFPSLSLTSSFRFPPAIAGLATGILDYKHHLGPFDSIAITGNGTSKSGTTKAVIARSNLGLLLKAIAYVTEKKKLGKIYFEGNIHSYTYADEGASLYDVLNLYNQKRTFIRDKLIQSMATLADLEEYIEKTEDGQLAMMVEIVQEYGNEIPGIIQQIKDKHCGDEDRSKAELIFSTVHRSKGMEYDEVQIVEDFLNEKNVEKMAAEKNSPAKINEEINLLYVAVTRAKNKVNIPESLVPVDLPPSPHIRVLQPEKDAAKNAQNPPAKNKKEKRQDSKKEARWQPPYKKEIRGSGKPWKPKEEAELRALFREGYSTSKLARTLKRHGADVSNKLRELGLRGSPDLDWSEL